MTARKRYTYCTLLFFFQLLYFEASTQRLPPSAFYYEHFDGEKGLLQNSINSILPDKNHFLWIATEGGIVRFNGNRFISVKQSDDLLKTNFTRVKALYRKGDDTIMAYSNNSRKLAFIVKNKIVSIEDQKVQQQGMLFYQQPCPIAAPSFIKGANGSLLASTGMSDWNLELTNYVGATYNKDTFCVVLKKGIGIYTSKGIIGTIPVTHIDPTRAIFSEQQIIYIDKDNYVNYYAPQGTLIKRNLLAIRSENPLSFYNNNAGNYFYCVADTVLYRINADPAGNLRIHQLVANLQNSKDISTIYEKDSNTVLTGTFGNGLYVYRRMYFSMTTLLPNQMSNCFYVQQLLSDSETILTGKGQLFRNDKYTGKSVQGIHWNMYSALKDRKGDYWYVADSCVLHTREMGTKVKIAVCVNGIFCFLLLEDREGRIWVASSMGLGYLQNGRFTKVKIKGVPLDIVTRMRQDSSGKYYIGTHNGLFVWDSISADAAKEIPGLKGYDIMFILPENNGRIWVSTYGNGIFLIDNNVVTCLSENDRRLAYVHTIVEDTSGYFWMPTINGLFVTTKASLLAYCKDKGRRPFFYEFSVKNGLRTNEFVGGGEPSFLRLRHNYISLAGMKGLVRFSPTQINFEFSHSPILIDNIELDSTKMKENDFLQISPTYKNIHFSVSTSYWGYKENDVFEYKVTDTEGIKEKDPWMQIDQSGDINLFAPGRGNYQLIIRKRTGFEATDYLYKIIHFNILPKWYQTKIFYVALTSIILLLMVGIFFWRRNYYRRANRILKEKVDIATVKLQQLNNTLEKKVEQRTIAIQEAEKKFRTLVEKSLIGVYIVQDGKFLYVNPKFEELLGYKTSELWQVDGLAVVKKTDHGIVNEKVRRRIAGEVESEHYEVTGIKKDGTERQLEFFGSKTIYEGKPTIIGTMLDITEKKMLEKQLLDLKIQEQKKVTRAILTGEERERNKIAQELHDNINQILVGTKLYLSLATGEKNGSTNIIERSMDLLDDAIEEIRVLTKEKAAPVKKEGLRELLQALIDRLAETTNIKPDYIYKGYTQKINDELKMNVYRIVQELLNNAVKHARAANLGLMVDVREKNIRVVVTDDGKGFETDTKRKGIGIANIVNRVESFNGTIDIESSPGKGCKTDIDLPL